ncbi:MAG: histidine phosphatase family protein [Herminiimonas sp.]|nr:histidine phosphatase family protein [Herminiimonas sp.]
MVEILLIRHGETAWNAEKRMQGHLDIGLNAAGLRQAAALGHALRHEPLDAIISSDLQRALLTAQAVAAGRNLTISTDAGLRERCFGVFEGLLYADLAAAHPQAFQAWKARELDARYPPGVHQAETLREFSARVLTTIDRLAASGAYRKIALVTHGGVLECAYRAATGTALQSVRDFDILNASVNRLHWTPAGMQVVAWGDVRHLQADPLAAGVLDDIDR